MKTGRLIDAKLICSAVYATFAGFDFMAYIEVLK
jgi:hypothetical protein